MVCYFLIIPTREKFLSSFFFFERGFSRIQMF